MPVKTERTPAAIKKGFSFMPRDCKAGFGYLKKGLRETGADHHVVYDKPPVSCVLSNAGEDLVLTILDHKKRATVGTVDICPEYFHFSNSRGPVGAGYGDLCSQGEVFDSLA